MNAHKTLLVILCLGITASFAQADTILITLDLEGWGDTTSNMEIIGAAGDFMLGEVASVESITVEFAHTAASDIIFSVISPGGTFSVLDGTDGGSANLGLVAGDSSLGNVAPYTFTDPIAGNGVWSSAVSPIPSPGPYDAVSWVAGPIPAGGWSMSLMDDFVGEAGSIGTVTIEFNPVPEPAFGLLALVGLIGMIVMRRR